MQSVVLTYERAETIIRRCLRHAVQELDFATARGKYEYTVVNDDFERALGELTGILEKELGGGPVP